MRQIALIGKYGQGKHTLVDEDDFRRYAGQRVYVSPTGYAMLDRQPLSRLIMKAPKGMVVDHINHDRLDNRKVNLRICTASQNHKNYGGDLPPSGYRGVYIGSGDKWKAVLRTKRIGFFDTKEEAALAWNRAAREAYGEFAYQNKVA